MIYSNLIILMFLAPLIGAVAQLFSAPRLLSLLCSIVPFVCLLLFIFQGDWATGKDVFTFKTEWIPHYQADFFLRLNGVNVFPLLSLSLASVFLLFSFWKKANFGQAFYGLALLTQAFMTIALLSGDVFVQMVFWGATSAPMYFLSALYGAKSGKAGFHFLMHSMLGTLLVFVGTLIVYYFASPHSFDLATIHAGQFQSVASTFLGVSAPEWAFILVCLGFFFRFPLFPFSGWLSVLAEEMSVEMLVVYLGMFLTSSAVIFSQFVIVVFGAQLSAYYPVFWVFGLLSCLLGAFQIVNRKSFSQLLNAFGMIFVGTILVALGSFGLFGTMSIGLLALNAGISFSGLAWVYSCLENRGFDWDKKNWKSTGVFFSTQSVIFANLAQVPITSAFVPVALMLSGTFERSASVSIIYISLSLIAAFGVYRVHEEKVLNSSGDKVGLDLREVSLGVFLMVSVIVLGMWPRELVKISQPAVGELIKTQSP